MNDKSKKSIYRITTAVTALAFLIPGFGNLFHVRHFSQNLLHPGYPAYFSTILGFWKTAGPLAIAVPNQNPLKERAYSGMLFDLTGASFSRISVQGEIIKEIIPSIIIPAVLTSWHLRPDNRKPIPIF